MVEIERTVEVDRRVRARVVKALASPVRRFVETSAFVTRTLPKLALQSWLPNELSWYSTMACWVGGLSIWSDDLIRQIRSAQLVWVHGPG